MYLKTAVILFYDNLSALFMTVNPSLHVRTTHIEMKYHSVTEKVAKDSL